MILTRGERKAAFAWGGLLFATALCAAGRLDGPSWVMAVDILALMFFGANVMEHRAARGPMQ